VFSKMGGTLPLLCYLIWTWEFSLSSWNLWFRTNLLLWYQCYCCQTLMIWNSSQELPRQRMHCFNS
jgi:hypothetical protein